MPLISIMQPKDKYTFSFTEQLNSIKSQLQAISLTVEFQRLKESSFYNPDVTWGDALQAVQEAHKSYIEMNGIEQTDSISHLKH